MSELRRHYEAMKKRDPVEHAFLAFASLSREQKSAMVNRFNKVFADRPNSERLSFAEAES